MNDTDSFEAVVGGLRRQADVPGLALAVIEDGQISYTFTFGEYQGKALTAETLVPVASLSKPIFAYAVMQLVQCGILDLDTPLATYLPELYTSSEPFLPFITARHVLSHTTGFPNWRDPIGLRAAFQPGTQFRYSTEGFNYLQTAVEQLLEKPIEKYVKKHL